MQFSDAESHLRPDRSETQPKVRAAIRADKPKSRAAREQTALLRPACTTPEGLGTQGTGRLNTLFTYTVRIFPLLCKRLTGKCTHKHHHPLFSY